MAIMLNIKGLATVGPYRLPGRKRPSICIEQGTVIRAYGGFNSENDADEFMDRLAKLLEASQNQERGLGHGYNEKRSD